MPSSATPPSSTTHRVGIALTMADIDHYEKTGEYPSAMNAWAFRYAISEMARVAFARSERREITELMVESAAQRMVALVMGGIIEKPQLVQWQQWSGSARAILEAALGEDQASLSATAPNVAAYTDRIGELEEILQELVTLKAMHDEIERIKPKDLSGPRNYRAEEMEEDYQNRKPKAWQRARESLE